MAQRLSRIDVVRAALRLLDEEGTDAVTLRGVARALGVHLNSVSLQVGSKARLLDLMADAILGELSFDALPAEPIERVKEIFRRYRQVLLDHRDGAHLVSGTRVSETNTLRLGDAVVGSHVKPGVAAWVRVTAEAWAEAGRVARDHLGCRFFDFLSGIDWMPSPYGRYEDAEIGSADGLASKVRAAMDAERETGYAGGDTRFQVFAHVVNTAEHHDVFLKVDVPEPALALPTWSRTYGLTVASFTRAA